MPDDYKICNNCGAKVNVNANFCTECKSQSFRTKSVVVRKNDEPASLKHRLLYWNYDGEFVLSKSKISGITVFLLVFISGLFTPLMGGMFLLALILAAITFLVGYLFHHFKGKPSDAVIRYNDYGLFPDLFHLLFFWQNRNTGEFVPSKTKIISFLIFVIFAILSVFQAGPTTLFVIFVIALIFDAPAFLIGCGIHKLTNPNPTNPKKIAPNKEPERIPKKEKIRHTIDEKFKKPAEEPKAIAKFTHYEDRVNELKDQFDAKQSVARDLIEKRFAPPQITYTRFISIVDKAAEIFERESASALNILHLATEDSPRIDTEIDAKIATMVSIIDRMDDLTNELILSMDSSKDDDAENLIDDMENLISSVKDYDD